MIEFRPPLGVPSVLLYGNGDEIAEIASDLGWRSDAMHWNCKKSNLMPRANLTIGSRGIAGLHIGGGTWGCLWI
jgi:hypothetical protein